MENAPPRRFHFIPNNLLGATDKWTVRSCLLLDKVAIGIYAFGHSEKGMARARQGMNCQGQMGAVRLLLTVVVFWSAAVALTMLSGCETDWSIWTRNPVSLSEVAMSQGVDPKTRMPIDPTDVFTTEAPAIYCSAKLSNAPPDTKVTAEWIYVKGELEGVSNHAIDTWSGNAEGRGYLYMMMARPEEGWVRVDYRVVPYLNDTKRANVSFQIR